MLVAVVAIASGVGFAWYLKEHHHLCICCEDSHERPFETHGEYVSQNSYAISAHMYTGYPHDEHQYLIKHNDSFSHQNTNVYIGVHQDQTNAQPLLGQHVDGHLLELRQRIIPVATHYN
jgi:hypothetical protein